MSHRRPPTMADRHVDELLRHHPRLAEVDHAVDSFGEEAVRWMVADNDRGPDMVASALRMANDPTYLLVEDIAMWSRWRTCRHVYRFDGNLTEELVRTPIPRDMPTDALRKMPYPIVFVEARMARNGADGGEVVSPGFFCWIDRSIAHGATSFTDGVESLSIMFLNEGRPRSILTVNLELPTVGECIDETVMIDAEERARMAMTGRVRVSYASDYDETVRRMYTTVVSHLLYIMSDQSDQEVTYRPSGGSRRKRTCKSTVHAVGQRVGRSIGDARVRYVGGEPSQHGDGTRTVRPHMRAGHWHHFWTGPRDRPDERELRLRWVMPTMVNAGGDDSTVVHGAKAK